jgi:hypothetical protein
VSDWFHWSAFGAAEVVFVGCTASNAATLVRYVVSKRKGSMIPFLGGVAGSVGVVVSPEPALRPFWWLPLLVDPGSVVFVVSALVALARRRGKHPDSDD